MWCWTDIPRCKFHINFPWGTRHDHICTGTVHSCPEETVSGLNNDKTGTVPITWHKGAYLQPLLQRKNNDYGILWMCIHSVGNEAWNAHTPYCHLLPVWRLHIFPHFLTNGTFSGKNLFNLKHLFLSSLKRLSEAFLIVRRTEREMITSWYWTAWKVPDFNENWIFSTGFWKIIKYQISWNSVAWEPSCSMGTDGRKDRQTWRSKLLLLQFCERA